MYGQWSHPVIELIFYADWLVKWSSWHVKLKSSGQAKWLKEWSSKEAICDVLSNSKQMVGSTGWSKWLVQLAEFAGWAKWRNWQDEPSNRVKLPNRLLEPSGQVEWPMVKPNGRVDWSCWVVNGSGRISSILNEVVKPGGKFEWSNWNWSLPVAKNMKSINRVKY